MHFKWRFHLLKYYAIFLSADLWNNLREHIEGCRLEMLLMQNVINIAGKLVGKCKWKHKEKFEPPENMPDRDIVMFSFIVLEV